MPKHNTPPKQKSPRKLIMLLSVVLALIVITTTYILLVPDNIFSKYLAQDTTTSNITNTTQPETPKPTTPTTPEPPKDTTNYLTLEDWGIKFTIPEGVEPVYYKTQNSTYGFEESNTKEDVYEFTTKGIEIFGGKGNNTCVEPNDKGWYPPRTFLIRKSKPIDGRVLLKDASINGYYYYLAGSAETCSEEGAATQSSQTKLLVEMLKTIEPIK